MQSSQSGGQESRGGHSIVLLDTGPLGLLTHPRRDLREEPTRWLTDLRRAGVRVAVPEVADYELRRELLRAGRNIERLEELERMLVYLPLTTAVMQRAAALWAEARNAGQPTAPDPALDGDAILAAQARVLEEELDSAVLVATTNPKHLSRLVEARDWREIKVESAGE